MDQSNEIKLAIEAAKKAGEIIREGFSKVNQVDVKEGKGFVTEVDRAAEKVIIETLEAGSSYKILAEETRHEVDGEDTYWVVDPLDGTTMFIHRLPFCSISIALIKNNEPVLGVVYNPILNEMFYGEKGSGAYLNEDKIQCSESAKIAFVNHGYDLESKLKRVNIIKEITEKFNTLGFGSTAYELANVAAGKADAFIAHGDELWDHAAGILLVREAGGIVTDWKGNDWTPKTNYVFASNKKTHDELLEITSRQ